MKDRDPLLSQKCIIAVGMVLSVPLLTTALLGSQLSLEGALTALRETDVLQMRSNVRAQKRAYMRAVERCQERLKRGEDVTCPKIHDPSTFSDEAAEEKEEPVEEVAEEHEAAMEERREPTTAERRLLRAYTRAGYCSRSGGEFVYDMCRLQTKGKTRARAGFLNDNIQLHSKHRSAPASMRLRMQMIDQAVNGSKRDPGALPMRFRGGLR